MNWRRAFETMVNWWYLVVAVAAAYASAVPMMIPLSDPEASKIAGSFAPVVALCVAAMILTEAVRAEGLRFRRTPSILIGLGSIASAYLWMAAASEAHPLNPELPRTLLVLFVIAALLTLFVLPTASWIKAQSNDQSPSDEDDHR